MQASQHSSFHNLPGALKGKTHTLLSLTVLSTPLGDVSLVVQGWGTRPAEGARQAEREFLEWRKIGYVMYACH